MGLIDEMSENRDRACTGMIERMRRNRAEPFIDEMSENRGRACMDVIERMRRNRAEPFIDEMSENRGRTRMGMIERMRRNRAQQSAGSRSVPRRLVKLFLAFLLFFFSFFPLFSQNNSGGTVSLSAEISRLERIAAAGNTAANERCGAFLELARLYRLSGNPEAAVKAYEGALAADPNNGEALLEQGRFLVSLGGYEKAATAINTLLKTNSDRGLLIQGRCLAAQLEAFRSGNTQVLAALASDPDFTAYRSGIYYTLWKLTGLVSWRSRLVLEFPQSPEAKIAAGTVDFAPTPLWLLFPGRESASSSGETPAPAVPAPSAPATPAVSPPASTSPAPRPALTPAAPVQAESGVILQAGLFSREDNARSLAGEIVKAGFEARVFRRRVNGSDFWAVGVPGGNDVNTVIKRLKEAGFESFPVSQPR